MLVLQILHTYISSTTCLLSFWILPFGLVEEDEFLLGPRCVLILKAVGRLRRQKGQLSRDLGWARWAAKQAAKLCQRKSHTTHRGRLYLPKTKANLKVTLVPVKVPVVVVSCSKRTWYFFSKGGFLCFTETFSPVSHLICDVCGLVPKALVRFRFTR